MDSLQGTAAAIQPMLAAGRMRRLCRRSRPMAGLPRAWYTNKGLLLARAPPVAALHVAFLDIAFASHNPPFIHSLVRTTDGMCHDIRIMYQGTVNRNTPLDNPDALAAAAEAGKRQCNTALGSGWTYVKTVNFDPQSGRNEWQHTCRICDRSLADAALLWCAWGNMFSCVNGAARFAASTTCLQTVRKCDFGVLPPTPFLQVWHFIRVLRQVSRTLQCLHYSGVHPDLLV